MRKTFTHEGKRYEVSGDTPEELAVKVAMKIRDLEEGRIVLSKNTPVNKWIEEWLANYKKNSVSQVTYTGYVSRINVHIIPTIGGMKIKDVRPIHLQKIMNGMTGYSKDYIAKVEYTLNQIFESAQKNKLILDNPARDLQKPKAENGTNRAITDAERKVILKVAETHKHGLWVKIMLYCGLRPGETRLIQGKHINLKNRTLKIEGTKSKAAKRTVPIPSVLIPDFGKVQPFEYVFKNKSGNQLTLSNLRSMWKNFKREMNIAMGCEVRRNKVIPPYRVADDLVPYCLRHTFCTDLQSAGVPINVAKELMGHTDISVTARIYTHQSEKSFNDAADAINEYQTKMENLRCQQKNLSTHKPTPIGTDKDIIITGNCK